jgi:hypothetical protein
MSRPVTREPRLLPPEERLASESAFVNREIHEMPESGNKQGEEFQ